MLINLNLINYAISSNTVRSTNNRDTMKNTSSITPDEVNISRDVRHMNHHISNIQALHLADSRPSGPAEPPTYTVVTITSSPSNTRRTTGGTSDVINDSITITTSSSAK